MRFPTNGTQPGPFDDVTMVSSMAHSTAQPPASGQRRFTEEPMRRLITSPGALDALVVGANLGGNSLRGPPSSTTA